MRLKELHRSLMFRGAGYADISAVGQTISNDPVIMATELSHVDSARIVVGAALPFSVYSTDRKLLLAKGRIVESERMRDYLVKAGCYQSGDSALELSLVEDLSQHEVAAGNPLDAFSREFHNTVGHSRISIRLSRDDTGDSYPCWVLGADEQHGIIVTAPTKPDRSLVPIAEGQTWVFRMLYLTAAVKFTGTIRKTQFDPVPLLTVSLPKRVEMRHVRASPRAITCLRGSIEVGKHIPVVIADISAGGVRIAVERANTELQAEQRLILSFCISILGTDYNFKVPATVIGIRNELDQRYPQLQFAGMQIEAQSEVERLVLHSYVFERTATDCNALWKALVTNVSA